MEDWKLTLAIFCLALGFGLFLYVLIGCLSSFQELDRLKLENETLLGRPHDDNRKL